MVNIMRVRKEWLEIIDENKALWRRLVLPKPKPKGGWDLSLLSIVELFDRKSDSSLEEVSMETRLDFQEAKSIVRVLAKSKKTLRILRIKEHDYFRRGDLAELSLKLLNLKECQIAPTFAQCQVHLVHSDSKGAEAGDQLRILWCPDFDNLRKSFSHLFSNLVSLGLGTYLSPASWRKILESPSQTLRHLIIYTSRPRPEDSLLSPIDLPKLEILEMKTQDSSLASSIFPSWIRVGPSLSTLIRHGHFYPSCPSVSTLWIDHPESIERLADNCPELVELRVDSHDYLCTNDLRALLSMLKQRKRKVEAGMEIEGIKMVHLKRLMIDLSECMSKEIVEMRKLVEQVSDLSTALPIELEI